jgi:hypothetical protein
MATSWIQIILRPGRESANIPQKLFPFQLSDSLMKFARNMPVSFFLGVHLFVNFSYTPPCLGSDCQHFDIHIRRCTFRPLKMRPFRCPETLVNKYAVTWRQVRKYRKPRTNVLYLISTSHLVKHIDLYSDEL